MLLNSLTLSVPAVVLAANVSQVYPKYLSFLAVDDREYKGLGLCSQHAYSVLSYATIGDERLLRIRNPHGTFVWSGVYGPMWLKGQPKLRHQLEPKGTEAGTFWMPFRECKHVQIILTLLF